MLNVLPSHSFKTKFKYLTASSHNYPPAAKLDQIPTMEPLQHLLH